MNLCLKKSNYFHFFGMKSLNSLKKQAKLTFFQNKTKNRKGKTAFLVWSTFDWKLQQITNINIFIYTI